MRVIEEKILKSFLVIINFTIVIKLIVDCFKIEELNFVFLILLFSMGILIYLFFSKVLNNTRKKIIFFIIAFILLGIIIYTTSGIFVLKEIEVISLNLKNINSAALKAKNINFEEFVHIFSITIPLLIAVLIAITQKFRYTPLVFSIGIFIIFWYQIFYKNVIPNIPYFIGNVIITLGIGEYIKKCREYRGREVKININIKYMITLILILSLVIPRLILILPQEYKGKTVNSVTTFFKNEFARKKENEKNPSLEALKGSFSMKQSGYSDSSKTLGGSIAINRREVFKVISDKPYYLRGKAMDYYTGRSWTKSEEKVMRKVEVNESSNMPMYKLIMPAKDENFEVEEKTLTIVPGKNFKTTSYFTPNNSNNIINDSKNLFVDLIPIFMSDVEIKEPYKVSYISYGDFDNYLEGIQNSLYKKTPLNENYIMPQREFGVDDYSYRENLISSIDTSKGIEYVNRESAFLNNFMLHYMNYLQLDAPINDEVYKIVDNILISEAQAKEKTVEELTTHEKALAIRSYLMKNYKYVTNVGENDEYNDFVSNFLLLDKKGYCTYFASATVMMCRIAGVPARYVEGFKMSDDKGEDGSYNVTNADAHAWAEILINPYRNQWAIVDSEPTPTEYEEAQEEIELENTPTENNPNNEAENNKINKNQPGFNEDEGEIGENGEFNKYIGVYITIGAVIIIIAVFVGLYEINKMRIVKNKSIIPLYNYYLKMLRTQGIVKSKSSGDLEFVDSIRDIELQNRLRDIVNLVYDEFYGEILPDEFEKKEHFMYIENYIKEREKWYKYIINKYFVFNIWRY
ncbi:transglutaminase-like domain-containing protein [Clostridium sp.]|uniref:transglutaminase-like domain-containing protein n=1 Tax=Clostridium sp. TaxID=1506 RepID=UPI003464D088